MGIERSPAVFSKGEPEPIKVKKTCSRSFSLWQKGPMSWNSEFFLPFQAALPLLALMCSSSWSVITDRKLLSMQYVDTTVLDIIQII